MRVVSFPRGNETRAVELPLEACVPFEQAYVLQLGGGIQRGAAPALAGARTGGRALHPVGSGKRVVTASTRHGGWILRGCKWARLGG